MDAYQPGPVVPQVAPPAAHAPVQGGGPTGVEKSRQQFGQQKLLVRHEAIDQETARLQAGVLITVFAFAVAKGTSPLELAGLACLAMAYFALKGMRA